MKLALLQPRWTTIGLGLSPPISQRGMWLSLLPGPAHLVVEEPGIELHLSLALNSPAARKKDLFDVVR